VIRRGAGGGFTRRQTLITNVGGGATGQLVPLSNGRTLAVIAGPQRLWASEAPSGGRFGAVRGLTPPGSAPAAVAVTGTTGGGSAIAWTMGSEGKVLAASSGPGATPSRPHTLFDLATGHSIDGLQIAARPDGLTLAWTESWNDSKGTYHARAMAADAVGRGRFTRPRALSAPGDVASGLVLSSDTVGAEVAAWDVCPPSSPACAVESRVRTGEPAVPRPGRKARKRPPARWFGPVSRVGQIDPDASPELATAPTGESLLGWITGARVTLAAKPPGAGRFGPVRLASGGLADNLDVGFGPTGEAVATWTEETAAPRVFVSVRR